MLFGSAALQNTIIKWSSDHRRHHKNLDTEKDPYSITKGFFHAHIGWILLDEPSMGLSPLLVQDIFATIKELHKSGVTILLVEQNVNHALKIADYGYVLTTGKIFLSGTYDELIKEEKVREQYLGEGKYISREKLWGG